MSTHIDLNCDMGESFGAWRMGADAEVLPWVTSVNIACGFHAGDPVTMCKTVKAAAAAGVAIGAHVALPDLAGFGRRAMAVSAAEVYAMTVVQLGALMAMARSVDAEVVHVKPHGALYHMAEQQPDIAGALVDAIAAVNRNLRVVGLTGGELVGAAEEAGMRVGNEAFIDRRYRRDGSLVPRGDKNAVIEDHGQALVQALELVRAGRAPLTGGGHIEVHADTLCIHGDRPDAAHFARHIHEGLREAGVELRAPRRNLDQ